MYERRKVRVKGCNGIFGMQIGPVIHLGGVGGLVGWVPVLLTNEDEPKFFESDKLECEKIVWESIDKIADQFPDVSMKHY